MIVPYPILLTASVAVMLEEYVREGGHLFVEARPGWVDENGRAQPLIPGFALHRLFGVREKSITPEVEFRVRWGSAEFTATTLEERFEVLDASAKPVAFFEDGTPAAFERKHGRGSALVLGAFARQSNETKPAAMHPLGEILARWAGLTPPQLTASAPVELKLLEGQAGQLMFFFNHGAQPAQVDYSSALERPATRLREVVTGTTLEPPGKGLRLRAEIPAQAARVYRIDF